jgi:hypothetical protein
MGLGHLSTLQNLELIGYHGSQEIRLADVKWMLQHWKNLRRITGDGLFLTLPKILEGVADERSRSVMKTLKFQQRSDLSFNSTIWRSPRAQEMKIDYCPESESESEVDDDGAE